MRHQLKHLAKSKAVKRSFNVNDEEAQILADEIDRADVNKDGTITMDEMTPTLDRFAKEGKFQPSAGGTTNEAHHPKYTAEDARNMSDDEFLTRIQKACQMMKLRQFTKVLKNLTSI